MPGNHKRDIEVFTEAIQLPDEERIAFLDRACAEDEGLRRRIEALLKSNDRAGDFLETPPTDAIGVGRAKVAAGEKPGDWVDKYKILHQIGEGGCGVVFVAEQEEPVRRSVALKVVKPGMDTKSVIARFEAERQALALMDHPNIAHVFDAGATSSGRPYFVMELVEGVKITNYCDQHSLSINARLELFIQVCDAIQHAHQKGIIHRDIKPSNILVTAGRDEKPASKVIDFGIAKAITGQQLTDKTIFTAHEMLLGTPAYMSPEQAALASTDIDTRTDIYSLGVLLYELLTGATPFDTRELLKVGFDEVRRVIRDEEPVRPSTRLNAMVVEDLGNISRRREAQVSKLIREMRGDLDWIVMKALEKDRKRRYATANGLAMDVGRFLHKEAVLARPPTAAYKLRKLFLRNKLLFVSLVSIFLLMVAILAVAARLLVVQRRAVHLASALEWEARATGYVTEGNAKEAKAALHQSLAIRRRYLNNEPPSASTIKIVSDFLLYDGSIDDAMALMSQVPTHSNIVQAAYLDDMFNRYNVTASTGDWKGTMPGAMLLVQMQPSDSRGYHMLAPLLVVTTNLQSYHQLCKKIVATFSNTTEFLVADRMAKDCLILPSAAVDLNAVAAMAKLAVTKGKDSYAYDFLVCCQALAQYRLGNYQEAIYWAQVSPQNKWVHPKAEASAILAMAQFKSGNIKVARQAMTNCDEFIARNLPVGEQPGLDWRDWIIAHALYSEAKRMIEGETSPATPPGDLPR